MLKSVVVQSIYVHFGVIFECCHIDKRLHTLMIVLDEKISIKISFKHISEQLKVR